MKESATLDQINKFLTDKQNKDYHYNDCESLDFKIPTGSLNLDLALGGGLPSGVHRFIGINEGGKTSCALSIAREFQKQFDNGMVVLVMSEGRFSKEMLERSGLDTDPNKLFRFDCNVFEKVFELVRMLVKDNPENNFDENNIETAIKSDFQPLTDCRATSQYRQRVAENLFKKFTYFVNNEFDREEISRVS